MQTQKNQPSIVFMEVSSNFFFIKIAQMSIIGYNFELYCQNKDTLTK